MPGISKTSKRTLIVAVVLSAMTLPAGIFAGCDSGNEQKRQGGQMQTDDTIKLTSGAFTDGKRIPEKYTADGADVSPPLKWSSLPAGTERLALIMDDPDAPVKTWVHLVLYGIDAKTDGLGDSLFRAGDPNGKAPAGMTLGKNSWGNARYQGPAPPPGKVHRYYFRLYALDAALKLQADLTKRQLLRAIEGHVLAAGTLMGTYGR